jgi:hypothetical protein
VSSLRDEADTVGSWPAGTTLLPSFFLRENLLYAFFPFPTPHLKPAVEDGYAIAAKGGEDVKIPSLYVGVDGLHDEISPDANSSQHHGNLESNRSVPLDSLSSFLRFHR